MHQLNYHGYMWTNVVVMCAVAAIQLVCGKDSVLQNTFNAIIIRFTGSGILTRTRVRRDQTSPGFVCPERQAGHRPAILTNRNFQ